MVRPVEVPGVGPEGLQFDQFAVAIVETHIDRPRQDDTRFAIEGHSLQTPSRTLVN